MSSTIHFVLYCAASHEFLNVLYLTLAHLYMGRLEEVVVGEIAKVLTIYDIFPATLS